MTETLMDINGLTKAYPGVVANNNVSFQIRIGEDHPFLLEIDYEKEPFKTKNLRPHRQTPRAAEVLR